MSDLPPNPRGTQHGLCACCGEYQVVSYPDGSEKCLASGLYYHPDEPGGKYSGRLRAMRKDRKRRGFPVLMLDTEEPRTFTHDPTD